MIQYFRSKNTRWALVVYDVIIYIATVFIFFIHFHGGGDLYSTAGIIEHVIIAFLCLFGARYFSGVYEQVWRYGGVQCYLLLIASDAAATVIYWVLDHVLPIDVLASSRVISVCALNCLAALAIRMIYRYCYKCGRDTDSFGRILNKLIRIFAGPQVLTQRGQMTAKRHIAIVGAGRVGVSLAEDLSNNESTPFVPALFIDANIRKAGRQIHGIPVVAETAVTADLLRSYDIEEITFALPNLDKAEKKKLYEFYRQFNLPIKLYDYPIMEAAGGKRQLRTFEIEEVLFRTPVVMENASTDAYYADKVILVTGGGGSIGSELSRQVAKMKPRQLILLDIYENGVYDLQQALKFRYGTDLDVRVEICSIANRVSLARVFEAYHPQIVINAAAHKHVPLMEHNVIEAIENNIFGTQNVIELCEEYGVERFMMLSTDKAVNPTNVMGATKRVCEMIMQAHSTVGKVRCTATRFGNVLGSAGSVIPLFKRQIAGGGPITITDKRIIRYFMTIPEASQLVLQSGAMAKNGELFVLDMGEPVKILDLAENMIALSGLRPYKDIDIVETGLRPGEKLYEELLVKSEELDKTDNSLIFIERDQPVTMPELAEKLAALREACASGDDDLARETLHRVVPTYRTPEEVNGAATGTGSLAHSEASQKSHN